MNWVEEPCRVIGGRRAIARPADGWELVAWYQGYWRVEGPTRRARGEDPAQRAYGYEGSLDAARRRAEHVYRAMALELRP